MELDLSGAVVVVPAGLEGPEARAVTMLVEEVEKRTGIRWPIVPGWPEGNSPVIGIGRAAAAAEVAGHFAPQVEAQTDLPGREGYRIRTFAEDGQPAVLLLGTDSRGVLFAAGHLLRKLRMARGSVRLAAALQVSTAPHYPLRGHQLGYRPKTNSYDGWSLPMWEQYFRDLAVFGANAVELIPPRSDDDADSPHFPLPPLETMVGMSRIADEYGLDVWIWYPAMDEEYGDPAVVEFALREWEEVFRSLPRIDAVFVPGGDPGHTQPRHLMDLLRRQTASLRRFHPTAEMWVSPQGFSAEWMEEFLRILQGEPDWLAGVVFGPQNRLGLREMRRRVPARYPIRHYPDITHTLRCQYPVPDWDPAFAVTLGREPINPRPRDMQRLFQRQQPLTCGFITYSEGCNDDVNKTVWSALGWDPEADVGEVLRDYARYFVSDRLAAPLAEGLLALERSWHGSLLANGGVETTLRQFQEMERTASPAERLSWRFQQALYRAYYDAFVRSRLVYEAALQEQALACLRQARGGSLAAIEEAEAILDEAVTRPAAGDLRARVFELAEALFQSIRMQLSVPRYQAIAVGRGANLDTIDAPLSDAPWLRRRLAEIREREGEEERRAAIEAVLDWSNPGPGGFYDELGNPERRPHLVAGPGFAEDPDFEASPRVGFALPGEARVAWTHFAETLYETPLVVRYAGLDAEARYRVRVLYGPERTRAKVRLEAGEALEVHDYLEKPYPPCPLEFDLPEGAVRSGELTLTWRREPGLGGNGRGCQVSEVWVLRK